MYVRCCNNRGSTAMIDLNFQTLRTFVTTRKFSPFTLNKPPMLPFSRAISCDSFYFSRMKIYCLLASHIHKRRQPTKKEGERKHLHVRTTCCCLIKSVKKFLLSSPNADMKERGGGERDVNLFGKRLSATCWVYLLFFFLHFLFK
jgi:hypothetical protein